MIKFGTGGFRGIIGDDFTKENVQKIAQALSIIIKKEKSQKSVSLGYDFRFMSENFAQWFCEVLIGNGIKVLFFDRATPTPSVMYSVIRNKQDFGVMITASHNPSVYNGVKIFVENGKDASVKFTNELESLINSNIEIISTDFSKGLEAKLVEMYDGLSIMYLTSF